MSQAKDPRVSQDSTAGSRVPWARRDEVGAFAGFYRTIRALLVEPKALFLGIDPRRPLVEPLVYAALVMLIGQGLEMFALALFGPLLPARLGGQDLSNVIGSLGGESLSSLPTGLVSFFGFQIALLSLPLVVLLMLVMLLLWTVIGHVGLAVLGGTRRSEGGLRATLAVLCYSSTASLAQVVPILGDLITVILAVFWSTIGLRQVHHANRFQALTAVLAPLLVLVMASLLAVILVG